MIELLAVVAIMGVMVAAGVVGLSAGRDAIKLKGSTRAAYAKMRHARSVAMITQQPSIVTYATETKDGLPCGRIKVDTAEIMSQRPAGKVTTLSGESVGDEGDAAADDAGQ